MRLEPQNSDLAFKTETVSDREVFFCERMSVCTVDVSLSRSAQKDFGLEPVLGSFNRTVDWDSRNRLRAGLTVGIENRSGISVRERIEGCRESADTCALAGSVEVQWRI